MSDIYGLNVEFDSLDKLLRREELDAEPVPLDVFVSDRRYLGLPPLSEIQTEIVKMSTQIFKLDTLIKLHGEEEGIRLYDTYTQNEVICQLGKGSGKDQCARIALAYTVY